MKNRCVLSLLVLAAACGKPPPTNLSNPEPLSLFENDDSLMSYLASLPEENTSGSVEAQGDAQSSPAPSPSGKSTNETITNNQEKGVDEGDIVKNIYDSLVVLRKGRLYLTDVATRGELKLSDSMAVARDDKLNNSVWDDEMLVKGNLIYVVGYRYGVQLEGC